MVWRTNERLTRGNEIPKKSCRPLQGSAGAAGERCAFFCKEEEDSRGGACFLLWRDSQLHAEEEERLLQVGGGCF